MPKLIIDYEDGVPIQQAIDAVRMVMSSGRVSEARGIPHYCWHTTFAGGIGVSVRQKRREDSADSFRVMREASE